MLNKFYDELLNVLHLLHGFLKNAAFLKQKSNFVEKKCEINGRNKLNGRNALWKLWEATGFRFLSKLKEHIITIFY